ncbi:TIGR03943 family putative permease subunit [Vacuolonema iberomarrocanum]|uniref:TIGR03943 family putative permease subunit n=1 Tax=Vacuolonema iberomarrocanum TaxID=3454632 RepID=UPI0019F73E9D|nr:TIGR03943 family protein [filamentous cyanobacterium LEGE 07170]
MAGSASDPTRSARRRSPFPWRYTLDTSALLVWAGLLLRFWLTGRINVLLHPDYVWLAVLAGVFLLGLGLWRGRLLLSATGRRIAIAQSTPQAQMQHFNLFPPGLSSGVLLVVALFGLQFVPQPFSSQMALDRGVTETLTMTRSQPQSFRGGTRPEERSLIDWVRTLNVYPEPDAYEGQTVNVEGFVIHSPELPDDYLMLARFVITCCAADVYPVGLPVKLTGDRADYPADAWLRVDGSMMTETLNGQRQLVIQAEQLTPIEEPENPYEY